MNIKETEDGTFYLEAQGPEDNNAVCVISEMMYALAEQGNVTEDLANRHGGVEKAGGFFNGVTIPGMDFVELANDNNKENGHE